MVGVFIAICVLLAALVTIGFAFVKWREWQVDSRRAGVRRKPRGRR